MNRRQPSPPAFSAWILRLALPSDAVGETIYGDLVEEFQELNEAGRKPARRWFRRQAIGVAVRFSALRAAGAARRAKAALKGASPMRDFTPDVRFALRSLRKRPGFTVVALLVLALGIGVNTAMFNLVNAVLLRPLPVESPDRLVTIYSTGGTGTDYGTHSYPDYADLRRQADLFSGLAAYSLMFGNLDWEGRAELLIGEIATCNYFDLLGVEMLRGRGFSSQDCAAELASPVAVLGYDFWQRRYAGDDAALGGGLSLNGQRYEIVGVAPQGFMGLTAGIAPSMWVPVMMAEKVEPVGFQDSAPSTGDTIIQRRGRRWLTLVGRLAPGASIEQARSQVDTIMARLEDGHPRSNENRGARLVAANDVRLHPDADAVMGPVGAFLLGVAGLVLLIACANVANMFLARVTSRKREIALRLALGAGRWRVVRQLLTESLVLALAGGSLGVLLAWWASQALSALPLPVSITVKVDLGLDWTVLAFAAAASMATGILFGLAPALRSTRPDLVPALKDSDRSDAQGGRLRLGLRQVLVAGQVAVSLILLVGAGLLIRSLSQAQSIDLGFPADRLAIASFNLEHQGITGERARQHFQRLLQRLRAMPQVEEAALANPSPFSLNMHQWDFRTESQSPADPPLTLDVAQVGPEYFQALGAGLVAGRAFTRHDTPQSPRVAVVSQALAKRFWPREGALGKRLITDDTKTSYEIVGVSEDYKVRTVGEAPRPFVHVAARQAPSEASGIVVRTRGRAADFLPELRRQVLALGPDTVFLEFGTLRQEVDRSLFGVRAGAALLGGFSLFALLLACVGLYGVIAYSVSGRTREIGTRMALGARRRDVTFQVVREGMTLALAGVAAGLLLSAGLSQLLSSVLYGIQPLDPASFALSALCLAGVALPANYIPARRAARVSPMQALRAE